MNPITRQLTEERTVEIQAAGAALPGNLVVPEGAEGIVLFAHGSGSSRHSPRNRHVALSLQDAGLATLLLDLLTAEEEDRDVITREHRFDIGLLADRLIETVDWLSQTAETQPLSIGCFGASTGAAAALIAAAERSDKVAAVVSRGGRPDLAGTALGHVCAPTLLIVGERDEAVLGLNRQALERLVQCPEKSIAVVPRATHLFEEPGALDEVARLTAQWFQRYLKGR